MAKPRKSWKQKLKSGRQIQIKPAPVDIAGMKAGQIMLIPTPELVDAAIRQIPNGQSWSIPELRNQLAIQNKAEVCCPITTGIFLRIVAEAGFEEYEAGADLADITPFWRVLDETAPTLKKLSFDTKFIFDLRQQEAL